MYWYESSASGLAAVANGDNATHGDNRILVSRLGMGRSDYVDVEALQWGSAQPIGGDKIRRTYNLRQTGQAQGD